MIKKKIIYRVLSYTIVVGVLYFLLKHLIKNWQEVGQFDFSFNYFYLIASVILLGTALLTMAFIWELILKRLEPDKKIAQRDIFFTYILTEFGKYLPGKIWSIVGKIQLGARYGLMKRNLLIASFLNSVILLIDTLLFGGLIIIFYLSQITLYAYVAFILFILTCLILIQPKIFYPVLNWIFRKIGKADIKFQKILNFKNILKIIAGCLIVTILYAVSFACLVASLTNITWVNLPAILSIFPLAASLGVLVLFAPSGLGVREGVTVGILQLFLPVSVAILIAMIARLWTTLTELLVLGITFILVKIKPKK